MQHQQPMNRREFLWRSGGGLGGIALAHLLSREGLLAGAAEAGNAPHHPPRAKRVVQLFMSGAASQVDTFDYKPCSSSATASPSIPAARSSCSRAIPAW
jgi:hypothetical protein